MAASLYSRYHDLEDDRWVDMLIAVDTSGNLLDRIRRRLRHGPAVPGVPRLPDGTVQRAYVGRSGAATLWEADRFYRFVKASCRRLGRPLGPDSRMLDFGCGWGRIARFFLKDVLGSHLLGVDVVPDIIQVCRDTLPEGRYDVIAPMPPTALPASSFDVIYAYSVLSHLAEPAHLAWVREFSRLLKPGGLLFATTQKRAFIEECNALSADDPTLNDWRRRLIATAAFRPLEATLAAYDRGEFVFATTGSGGVLDAALYGEAAVSERYVDQHWPPYLDKVAFDDQALVQAVIVARAR